MMNDATQRIRRNILKRLKRHIKKARAIKDYSKAQELRDILNRIKLHSTRPYCIFCGEIKVSPNCCSRAELYF